MTPTALLADVRHHVATSAGPGLTATRLELADDVAELTLAFTPEALERVLRAELAATGGPGDWNCPESPLDTGSPTWAYALEMTELFNEEYLKRLVFERLEDGLELLLAIHGHEGTPVVLRPAYVPADLMMGLRRLKTEHLRGARDGGEAVHAA